MEREKKLIILGVIILILIISGLTYAILTWTSSKINIGLISGCFTIDYTKGQDISGNLKLLNINEQFDNDGNFVIEEGMGLSYANLGIKSSCTIEGYGSLYLNVTTLSDSFKEGGDSKGALGYALLRNTSNLSNDKLTIENLKGQSFEMIDAKPITNTGTIKLVTEQLSNTELNKYLIVIFVDSYSAGNSITSASFSGNISADAEQLVPTPSYCFTLTNRDETNKTASIEDYKCGVGNKNGYEEITDVIIPSVINGYKIVRIGNKQQYPCSSYDVTCSFSGWDLENVIIPNSVTEIGTDAFANNQLASIIIPDSVTTIGASAFEYNQLASIIIPDSVTTIGISAFAYNNLNYVLINVASNLTSIGNYSFESSNYSFNSNGITHVDNPNLKIYNNSGKAFDWNLAVNGTSGTSFETGTTNAKTSGDRTYNAVTVTTGQPGDR